MAISGSFNISEFAGRAVSMVMFCAGVELAAELGTRHGPYALRQAKARSGFRNLTSKKKSFFEAEI
jgi:hypothetical protein